jgi:class 3 adenylate cyclase
VKRLDTDPRLLAALRRLRQRLPGDEQFGDPLSAAAETPAAYVARSVSVLSPERDSAVEELSMTALQLWQSLSEKAGRGRGDEPLALLYTDLVGYSTWALEAGDTAALDLLSRVGGAIEAPIEAHRGRVVKRLGDGLIATFREVSAAVAAALDAQEAIGGVTIDGYQPQMRAGIHWGRPRKLGGDYLGADISILAAVGEHARAGQVLVSSAALSWLDAEALNLRVGRRRRLRGREAPREVLVASVRRRT